MFDEKMGVNVMKRSNTLVILVLLVALVAAVAAGTGLFLGSGDGSFSFMTLHGQEVEINGRGLYHYDTAFKAPVFRGADAIMLFLGVPMLILSIVLYIRGSLRGGLLLTGVLACFLYNAASLAFGAAYNPLFLLYVVYFSASLYAFVLAFAAIDLPALPKRIASRMPHRGMAIFIFVAGLSPCVWLIDIVIGLVEGHVPSLLASYTTDITTVLDIGIITPAAFLAGVLLLRRKPLGYVLTSTLLILLTLIGLIVVGQTVMQMIDGIALSTGEIVAFVAPFVTLSLIAIGLTAVLLRNISEVNPELM